MKKYLLLLLLTACFGCASSFRKEIVTVSLVDSGRNLKLAGINDEILQQINRDSITSGWQSLAPVYRMPADTDMKDYQKAQPGKYKVMDSVVIFTPDTPFTKQQTYFVRWYRYNKGNTAIDYIRNGKKLGKVAYTDLIFKQ